MKLTQITPNLHQFKAGIQNVFFSYETPIAFYDSDLEMLIVSKNIWTRTTGKHLSKVKQVFPKHHEVDNDMFVSLLKDYTF